MMEEQSVDWSNVDSTLKCISTCLRRVGLKLNMNKTIVYTMFSNQQEIELLKKKWNIQIKKGLNFPMLGTYIGDKDRTRIWLNDKKNELQYFMGKIKELESKQTQWSILRYTYAFPKFFNIFRTIPYRYLMNFILEIDKMTQNTISHILETHLTQQKLLQSQLPMSHGGLGMMAIRSTIEAIKTSSWNQIDQRMDAILVESRTSKKKEFESLTMEHQEMKQNYMDKIGDELTATISLKQ